MTPGWDGKNPLVERRYSGWTPGGGIQFIGGMPAGWKRSEHRAAPLALPPGPKRRLTLADMHRRIDALESGATSLDDVP